MQLAAYLQAMTPKPAKKKPQMNDRLLPVISKRDRQQRNGSDVGNVYDIKAVIRKEGGQYCVRSESGKNLGCSRSKAEAHKRLAEVEYFKRKKS